MTGRLHPNSRIPCASGLQTVPPLHNPQPGAMLSAVWYPKSGAAHPDHPPSSASRHTDSALWCHTAMAECDSPNPLASHLLIPCDTQKWFKALGGSWAGAELQEDPILRTRGCLCAESLSLRGMGHLPPREMLPPGNGPHIPSIPHFTQGHSVPQLSRTLQWCFGAD